MTAGRPPEYENPEEMQEAVDKFFATEGKKTITGLALALGYCSRQSIYDNMKKDKFSYILKRALLQIENNYVEKLDGNNVTGPIFVLKNMGWADRQEIQQDSRIEMVPRFEERSSN